MKLNKALIPTLCSTVLLSSMLLVPSANASQSTYDENNYSQTQSNIGPSVLDQVLAKENLSEKELIEYGNYVKQQSAEGPAERWKGAVVKKAVKYMVDHSNIIPSKTLRNAVDKYGKQIISAIDTAETYTWYGIATALTKAGVPEKYADLIADFIVKFLLWFY